MTQIVIGIDPGVTGAIAAIDFRGALLAVKDIPVMMIGKGGGKVKYQVNAAALTRCMMDIADGDADDVLVAIEAVHAMPAQGVSSVFSLGDSAGCIRGVVQSRGYRLEYTSPAAWKRSFGLSSDKEEARSKAIQLFPMAPLSRKKDHNRAEALLIAEYSRRFFL